MRGSPPARAVLAVAALLALLAPVRARAVTRTWNGGTDGLWSTAANWSPSSQPLAGDTLVFDGSGGGGETTLTTLDLPGLSVTSLSLSTKTYTIDDGGVGANNPITISGGLTSASANTFNVGFFVGGDQTWSVGADTTWNSGTGSSGSLNLGTAALTVDVTDVAATAHLAIAVTGAGQIVKAGPGTLRLSGSRIYTGQTVVNAGTVNVTAGSIPGPVVVNGGTLSLHQNYQISVKPLTVASGATVQLDNTAQRVTTLAGGGTIDLGSGAGSSGVGLEVASGTFTGTIGGNGDVIHRGSGTVVLTGTHGFNGLFRATNAGATLQLDGTTPQNVLLSSATATIAGSGTIGDVNVGSSGGTIAPGAAPSGIGTLTVGNLDLFTATSGGTLAIELDGAASFDTLAATGTVDVGGGDLTVILRYIPTPGATFRILDNQGVGAITGTFNGKAGGSTFDVTPSGGGGAVTFQIDYDGGSGGNDVVLTVLNVATTTTTTTSTTTSTSTSTTTTTSTSTSTSSTTTTSTSTSTTTSTVTTSTTTSTLPFAECPTGIVMAGPVVTITNAAVPGRQKLLLSGALPFLASAPIPFNPVATGAQLYVDDGGSPTGTPLLAFTARTGNPIPGGAVGPACRGRRDGWKGTTYVNTSGLVDPPACTQSANGLVSLQLRDRRASGRGIEFVAKTRRSRFAVPVGPLRAAIVLGATQADGDAGYCGVVAFDAGRCRAKGRAFVCR